MSTRLQLVAVLSLAPVGACHRTPSSPPMVVDGHTLNPDPWLKDRQTILQRASFDLNCEESKIEVKVLAVGGPQIFDDWASQVGVAGCEQRAVYVRTQSGWVANTTSSSAK